MVLPSFIRVDSCAFVVDEIENDNDEGMILASESPATAGRLRIDAKEIPEPESPKPFACWCVSWADCILTVVSPEPASPRKLSGLQLLSVLSAESAVLPPSIRVYGSPIPANDAWIAALARQHRMPIVSRDVHFDRVKSVERLGWAPA